MSLKLNAVAGTETGDSRGDGGKASNRLSGSVQTGQNCNFVLNYSEFSNLVIRIFRLLND